MPRDDAKAYRTPLPGLLAALLESSRSGQGQVIDAAIVDGYAGDFLPDDRFDDWTAPVREALKLLVHDSLVVITPRHGLYVADASVMPTIPNANTNAPCIMIGEKFSDLLLSR